MEDEARKTRKRVSPPTLPRGFTPTREQLERAMQIIRAGINSGPAPSNDADSAGQLAQVHALGPGALTTGHGLAGGGRRAEGSRAYMAFVEGVRELVGGKTWSRLDVLDQVAWVQIRGLRGRIYVAKTAGVVSRVESTLDPAEVPELPPAPTGAVNASEPDRPNGKIRSWLRADVELVAEAVKLIAGADSHEAG